MRFAPDLEKTLRISNEEIQRRTGEIFNVFAIGDFYSTEVSRVVFSS